MASCSELMDHWVRAVRAELPDGDYIEVARMSLGDRADWRIRARLPRRDRRYRVIPGTEEIRADGETIPEAVAKLVENAHFHRTGVLAGGPQDHPPEVGS